MLTSLRTLSSVRSFVPRRSLLSIPAPLQTAESARYSSSRSSSSSATTSTTGDTTTSEKTATKTNSSVPPWNDPDLLERLTRKKRNNNNRFRQHVNPLSQQYQRSTILTETWPADVYDDCSERMLHVDIGCGKGGFLLELAAQQQQQQQQQLNYLGLEIRPSVALYAKERINRHGQQGRLDFVGCNANVDLHRLLDRYRTASGKQCPVATVTIQFPDPHFKSQHAKRRVVKPTLVQCLATFMPPDSVVFLQSDVQSVLDDMRERFRQHESLFTDSLGDDLGCYLEQNSLGVPTEREVSVLKKGLPVYRAMFRRKATAAEYAVNDEGEEG